MGPKLNIASSEILKLKYFYSGIHAFWKGQGDRDQIRTTQANIMKQYMDAEADPCHDFYQYACGNWAALNPIPADKAGFVALIVLYCCVLKNQAKYLMDCFIIFSYDTFEMLRENLDTVLKELLEFKTKDKIPCKYPGSNLDLKDNFLLTLKLPHEEPKASPRSEILDGKLYYQKDLYNNPAAQEYRYGTADKEKTQIVYRIRRYLDKKSKQVLKPIYKIKKYLSRNDKLKKQRIKRLTKKSDSGRQTKVFRRKFIIQSKQIQNDRRLMAYRARNKRRIERETTLIVGKHAMVTTTQSAETKLPSKDNNGARFKRRKERETKLIVGKKIIPTEKLSVKVTSGDDPANGDAALKARFLFKSCMNYGILEKRAHQPLVDLLDLLGGWPILKPDWDSSKFDWLELMAKLRLYNNDILISEWVGPDIKNSDEYVIQFDQTSLGTYIIFIPYVIVDIIEHTSFQNKWLSRYMYHCRVTNSRLFLARIK